MSSFAPQDKWVREKSLSLVPFIFSRDLLSEDTSYKMEVKMNPEGGGLHIPGLSYVNVDSVEHVNEV